MLAHNGRRRFLCGFFYIAFNGFLELFLVAVKVQNIFTNGIENRSKNVHNNKGIDKSVLKPAKMPEKEHNYSRRH